MQRLPGRMQAWFLFSQIAFCYLSDSLATFSFELLVSRLLCMVHRTQVSAGSHVMQTPCQLVHESGTLREKAVRSKDSD